MRKKSDGRCGDEEEEGGRFRKVVKLPELEGPFKGHPDPPVVDLKGKTVQVIVKLANIVLAPGAPSYEGGSWHIEGTSRRVNKPSV